MHICRDLVPVIRFLEDNTPASLSLLNIVTGRTDESAAWVRADNPDSPRVVLARSRWLQMLSPDRKPGIAALDWLPGRWRIRFRAAPDWAWRYLRRRKRVTWQTRCLMYALTDPKELQIRPRHRIRPLTPTDAPLIAQHWPYGRRPDYILERIHRGPTAAVYRQGRPVAWALTHSDGSMGFLHVLPSYRGQDMARSIGAWLARRQLQAGTGAFVYIERTNRASLNLTESLGFKPVGEYVWCGA